MESKDKLIIEGFAKFYNRIKRDGEDEVNEIKLSQLNKEVINEGASSILYHFTRLSRLSNILSTNSLYLTPAVSKSEKTKGRSYFMSFTRTKGIKQGYGNSFTSPPAVRIKFDGQKLGNRYKVMPIDYWQYPKTVDIMMKNSGDEMEDRVISNEDEIPNANKYIIYIDIFIGDKSVPRNIIEDAKKLGVQLYFYDNVNDFGSGDIKRGIKPNIIDSSEDNGGYINSMVTTIGALTYKEPKLYNSIFIELKDKFGISDDMIDKYKNSVKEYHEKLNYYLRPNNDYHLTDLANSLGSELHNNKTSSDKRTRYIIKLFLRDMRRTKSTSVKDYLVNKLWLGKKTQKDFNNELNNKLVEVISTKFQEGLDDLGYEVYYKGGNSAGLLNELPALLKFLKTKYKLVKDYITEFTLNNDDMFKSGWKLSHPEIKHNVDIISGSDEVINQLDDVTIEEVLRPIYVILWEVSSVANEEIEKIQDDNRKQWGN